MKKYTVAILVLCALFCSVRSFAKDNRIPPPSVILTGEVKGTLQSCKSGSLMEGILVHIPGLSIMAKTNSIGAFQLLNVPSGRHELVIEASPAQPHGVSNFMVLPRKVTDLKIIEVCDRCSGNDDCNIGFYCIKRNGECDAAGMCAPHMRPCPLSYDPVCGCDGNTYDNICLASREGVSVSRAGSCEGEVPCKENADCGAEDLYCKKPTGQCAADGICAMKERPMNICAGPACGCDGYDYESDCQAFREGMNVSHLGQCFIAIPVPTPPVLIPPCEDEGEDVPCWRPAPPLQPIPLPQ